jgi:ribosome-associated protein
MDIRAKQRAVVAALEDVKGRDIVVFDVAKQTAYFERVIIASGDSSRQVNALATGVQEKLKALGAHIVGVEGRRNGDWVLVDLGDIVVHVMHPAVRSHYNLEELWGDKEVRQKPKAKAKAKAKPAARKKQKRPRAKTARPRRRK